MVEQPKGTTVIELNFSPNPDPSISTTLRQDTTELQAPELKVKTDRIVHPKELVRIKINLILMVKVVKVRRH